MREHRPFFFHGPDKRQFLNHYVDVLWPRIDEFVQLHEDQKANDYFAAGKAMQNALRHAKLKPPDWSSKKAPPPDDIDDEIPF